MESDCPEPEPESHKDSSSPAETIANHDDLLSQILIRLESKSLIRYKSVSKHWLSLISSPKFCERHTLRHLNPSISGFFFLSTKHDVSFVSLPDDENPSGSRSVPVDLVPGVHGVKIMQSCNGLLLCCSDGEETSRTRRSKAYYVVNPTASQFSKLPYPSHGYHFDDDDSCLGVGLTFDPYKTGKVDYKVVAVWRISSETIRIWVYASDTGGWSLCSSEVHFTHQGQFEVDFGHGVYYNGAIHWLGHKDELFYCHIGDGSDEKPVTGGLVSSPLSLLTLVFEREYRYFGESCGHLHLIDIFRPCVTQFDVMELEPDYSGWSVKYHVDVDPVIETFRPCVNEMLMPREYSGSFVKCKTDLNSTSYSFQEVVGYYLDRYYSFVVLSLTREENGGDPCLLLYFSTKVFSYNLSNKTFKKLRDLVPEGTAETKRWLQVEWLEAYHHMGTLACV